MQFFGLDKSIKFMYICWLMKNRGRKKNTRKQVRSKEGIYLTTKNYILAAIGILSIILGYIFLGQPPVDSFWSLNVAPVILVIAYCVIVPIAILYVDQKNKGKQDKGPQEKSQKSN